MLATALLLGIGLIAVTWSSWRDAEELRSKLDTTKWHLAPSPTSRPAAVHPSLAENLVARSRRNFALGITSASLLAIGAALLWHRARREETLAERRAREERLLALGTMSAVLAHEIKNPLAALKGNAQLVAEALPDQSLRRAQADRVVQASIRLQALVGDLLNFTRGWPLDPTRIRQALENLLRNAVQASAESGRGRVLASVLVEGDRLVYTVRDEGPGLPNGADETIFEPFVTTKTRGVGLGLPVARRIAELHGGELTARNRPEGGAELRLVIPRE
jgi:two-component system sensor histidine kinase HydH